METKDKAKLNIVLVIGAVVKKSPLRKATADQVKVLIGQRSWKEVQAAGMWSLPGGKVEVEGDFWGWG